MPSRRELIRLAAALPFGLPEPPESWTLLAVPDERVVLTEPHGATRLNVPAARCRLLASFRLAGQPVAAIRFGAWTRMGEEFDLMAVAGGGRLLALEPWAGISATGAHLASRLGVLPGGRGLIMSRNVAVPNAGHTAWRREAWTDLLIVEPFTLIQDQLRRPLAGTCQAAMASRRAAVLLWLDRPTAIVTEELAGLVAVWPWDTASGSGPHSGSVSSSSSTEGGSSAVRSRRSTMLSTR